MHSKLCSSLNLPRGTIFSHIVFSLSTPHSLFTHILMPLSFTFNDNPCNGSFVFYWFHPATMSIGYYFFIRELLWHQWQLYSQQYPPLALMETSKHSPPLTTMTNDNLYCCTHFDIGFHVFFFLTTPLVIISPLC